MLDAYFDDSGTHQGSPAISVAGYMSTPDRWKRFESEWRETLDAYGVEFFHMTDFASGMQQFKDWPRAKREPRLNKLISISNRNVLFSTASVVPAEVYDASLRHLSHPYDIAARQCLVMALGYARQAKLAGTISFVFESGTRGAHNFLAAYQAIHEKYRARLDLGPLSFADKKKCLPLQAADILAYELHKEIPRHRGTDLRPSRTRILDLLKRSPHEWRFASSAGFAGAILPGGRCRKGGEAPLRGYSL